MPVAVLRPRTGGVEQERRVRGATVHKAGSKIPTWLYLQSINSDKHLVLMSIYLISPWCGRTNYTNIKKRKPPLMFHLSSIKLGYNPLHQRESPCVNQKVIGCPSLLTGPVLPPPPPISLICPHASPSSFLSCTKMPLLRIRLRDPVPFWPLDPWSDFRDPE